MFYEKEIIKIFKTLIVKYKLTPLQKSDEVFELIGSQFTIQIIIFFGEVDVIIKKHHTDEQGIQPLIWAYLTNQVDYRNLESVSYSDTCIMRDIVLSRIRKEYSTIIMFCGKLLNGEFPDLNGFKVKEQELLLNINKHFLSKSRR